MVKWSMPFSWDIQTCLIIFGLIKKIPPPPCQSFGPVQTYQCQSGGSRGLPGWEHRLQETSKIITSTSWFWWLLTSLHVLSKNKIFRVAPPGASLRCFCSWQFFVGVIKLKAAIGPISLSGWSGFILRRILFSGMAPGAAGRQPRGKIYFKGKWSHVYLHCALLISAPITINW